MVNKYKGFITALNKKDIFVFGSNMQGFHGAGAAGYASFGVSGNQWKKFDYGNKPFGWKGKWNQKGLAEGLQTGIEGYSYAIPTVAKIGQKRSRTANQIISSIKLMYKVARYNPSWKFIVAQNTKGGLNGYSAEEMAYMFLQAGPIPENVWFEEGFGYLIESKGIKYV